MRLTGAEYQRRYMNRLKEGWAVAEEMRRVLEVELGFGKDVADEVFTRAKKIISEKVKEN